MDFSPLLLVQALLIVGVFMDIVDAGKKKTIQVKSQKCIRNHLTIEPNPGGYSTKFYTGWLHTEVRPLTGFYILFLDEKVPLS